MPITTEQPVQPRTSLRAALLGGAAGLLVATAAVTLAMGQLDWWRGLLSGSAPSQPVAAGLEHLTTTAAAALLGWGAVLLLLAAATVSPGRALRPARRLGSRLAPRIVARVGAVLLAVAVAGPVAASAAAPGPGPGAVLDAAPGAGAAVGTAAAPDWSRQTTVPRGGVGDTDHTPAPQPGWQPPEPRQRADVRLLVGGGPRADAASRETVSETVVVRSGDTLWSIAARHLGPDASPEDIAAEWPRWHQANRDLIGPDPDLIRPGQELVAPPTYAPTHASTGTDS